MADRPLDGILVVALEQAVAAPMCTRTLADLGARVIKIENPDSGDLTRGYDTYANGISTYFAWVNRGKESVVLDLKDPVGQGNLRALVAQADVFVQNLAPGATARYGIDSAALREANSRLVTVDISGYGHGGPYDHRRAYDLLVQAEGGACSYTGWEGKPAKSGPPLVDLGTSMYAATAVLAALVARCSTGEGTAIEIAMLDVVAEWMQFAYTQAIHTGGGPQPAGLASPLVAPYNGYVTSDGDTAVLGTTGDREWRKFARELLGNKELSEDSRYATTPDRLALRAELDALIGAWVAERTMAQVQHAADDAGIGCSRLSSVAEAAQHPQLAARGRWQEVQSEVGALPALLPPITGWPQEMAPIPAHGEHTAAVLSEFGLRSG